jgi:hypothetical protein
MGGSEQKMKTEYDYWDFVLADYKPSEWWHRQLATEKQLTFLARFGWKVPEEATRGECAHVIGRMGAMPTPKQRRVLERRGLWHDHMDRIEATEAITTLAEQEGWT